MTRIPSLSFRAKSRNLLLLLTPLLLCGCAASSQHHARLDRVEVLRIAKLSAKKNHVALGNYLDPKIIFERTNDYQWTLHFDRKPIHNRNDGFLVTVDDRAGAAFFYKYSQLPTE
ncbi:MAG: hypothetical protein JWO45_314 [Spartobacteria bacterium]|nr:hypothetical protein [Spartobacteria bacterium]